MATANDNQILTIEAESTKNLIERNIKSGFEDLDPQKKGFAYEYLLDYNHRRAAKEVGFSEGRGIKLLREPLVAAFVAHLQEHNHVTNIITEDFIRTQWLKLIPKLAGEEDVPVVLADGDEISVRKFYPGELNNVIKELAKTTKIYENGSSSDSAMVNINIDVSKLLGRKEGIIIEGSSDEIPEDI